MGDMGDDFRAMREAKRDQHAEWKKTNTELLAASGLQFESRNAGECLVFRENGKPKVAFYPSTGRWVVSGRGSMHGGARTFMAWYQKQTLKP